MPDVDEFSRLLLEEAKRFLEKSEEANTDGATAFLHAALALGFCALEAYVNSICEDFQGGTDLEVLERSILTEREFKLEKGQFLLTDRLKIYRLEDRIEFLHRKFGGTELDKSAAQWGKLQRATNLRNELVHPKGKPTVTLEAVRDALESIIDTLEHFLFNLRR